MNKKNKSILIILLVLCIGLVGITIAYFSNSTTIDNEFNTKEYGTTYIEEFVSPDNWLPGDTTNKTLTVTNSGGVDEAVRISLTEFWAPNNANATLTGWIHADGTKSNHTTEEELATDERAAVINFTNNSDWTKVGDYYYYNYKLAPGETTDSLIESVTFNALTKLGDTCTPSTSNGTTTIICNSSGSDYDHATYKLTINIETVQYNKYKEAWGVDVATFGMKPMTAQKFISKANPVSVTNYVDGDIHEMYTFEHDATEQTPALTDYRYIGDDPYNYVYFNCDSLDNQNSNTCEVWRIIGVFDVEDEDGNWETRYKIVRGSAFEEKMFWNSERLNDWTKASLKVFLNDAYYNRSGEAVTYGLKNTSRKMIANTKYYLGGDKYNSSREARFGTTKEIYEWERGTKTYNPNDLFGANYCDRHEEDFDCNYTRSINWTGKIALIYPSDIFMTYANGVEDKCYGDPNMCYNAQDNDAHPNNSWIYNSDAREGQEIIDDTMWYLNPTIQAPASVMYMLPGGGIDDMTSIYSSKITRPTLYLKCNVKIMDGNGSIDNPYKLGYTDEYATYTKGQIVMYDNQEYYVMNTSEGNKSYVKLLKKEPLTTSEINGYNTNYVSNNGEYPYLENSTCTSGNTTNCSTNYDISSIKTIIDNWSSNYNNDLVSINGYKARLVNENDISNNFSYENYVSGTDSRIQTTSDTPSWVIINGKSYWSMYNSSDSNTRVYGVSNTLSSENVYNKLYIRPVINLKKCALNNTCE